MIRYCSKCGRLMTPTMVTPSGGINPEKPYGGMRRKLVCPYDGTVRFSA